MDFQKTIGHGVGTSAMCKLSLAEVPPQPHLQPGKVVLAPPGGESRAQLVPLDFLRLVAVQSLRSLFV